MIIIRAYTYHLLFIHANLAPLFSVPAARGPTLRVSTLGSGDGGRSLFESAYPPCAYMPQDSALPLAVNGITAQQAIVHAPLLQPLPYARRVWKDWHVFYYVCVF